MRCQSGRTGPGKFKKWVWWGVGNGFRGEQESEHLIQRMYLGVILYIFSLRNLEDKDKETGDPIRTTSLDHHWKSPGTACSFDTIHYVWHLSHQTAVGGSTESKCLLKALTRTSGGSCCW